MRKLFPLVVLVVLTVPCLLLATTPAIRQQSDPIPTAVQQITTPEANDGVIDMFPAEHGRQGGSLDAFDSTIWFDDFEGTQPAWTTTDLTLSPLYWHLDSRRALGGSGFAWACWDSATNFYNDHWLQFLVTPTLDLSATASPTLAFKARWKTEEPVGATPPYNAWDGWNMWVSTDNGSTWNILQPTVPAAYTASASFAWGEIWGYGDGIPVFSWTTGSNCDTVYQPMVFDLSAYRTSNVKLRWGLGSDDGFSGIDDPSFFGLAVDSIRVMDGASTLLTNDGTLDAFTRDHNLPVGQAWQIDQDTNHSPTHEWRCVPANHLLCAVKSPLISLPVLGANQTLTLRYWVWADQPGWSAPGNVLADYYDIWVEDADSTVQLVYDYAYNDGSPSPGGNSLLGWVFRTRGLKSGGVQQSTIDLTPWAGRSIKLWYRARYDGQDTTGVGTGVHLDDVSVVYTRAFNTDLACTNFTVNFPTTVGLQQKYSYTIKNEGLQNQGPAIRTRARYQKPDGTVQFDSLIVLTAPLGPNQDTTATRFWTPAVTGCYRARAQAAQTGDQDRTNDTLYSPTNVPANPDSNFAITVRPAGQYELAYHLRDMTSALLNPRYVHYKPAQDGVPAGTVNAMDITTIRVMWQFDTDIADLPGGNATAWIEFWEPGPDSAHPGALINRVEVDIDTSSTIGALGMPHWWTLNVSGTPGLQNRSGDFWVSITPKDSINGQALPHIMGKSTVPASYDGHNYTMRIDTVGSPLNPSPSRFCIQTTIVPTTTSTPDPVTTLTAIRAGTTNDVQLNWLPAARATGYNVYRLTSVSQDYHTGTKLNALPVNGTAFTDSGVLGTGLKYFYQIVAIN